MQQDNPTYLDSGFDVYLTRSIDGYLNESLGNAEPRAGVQQIAYDRNQITGSVGDIFKIGNSAIIDGKTGRISVLDENNNEIVRIGNLEV